MDHIIGHPVIVSQLKRQVGENTISHAYLFSGISGIGKKKTALAFAKMILCQENSRPCGHCPVCKQVEHLNYPDLLIIGPEKGEASIKIARIRAMMNELSVKPYSGEKRIIIIEEAEKMTIEAQNSLLKSLEEPLSHNLFILITEYPQKILPTIRSRCQAYHFQALSKKEIREVLLIETDFDEDKIDLVLAQASGSAEKALYFLKNPEVHEERLELLRQFYSLLKGDLLKILTLAERLGSDKKNSQETAEFLIRFFYEVDLCLKEYQLLEQNETGNVHQAFVKILKEDKIEKIIQTLFEMMGSLQYNVNLRLQWEKTLIQLIKIQKG